MCASNATYGVTGMPSARSARFIATLFMPTAEARMPHPTYGTFSDSSSPCTTPSSPYGPCSTGKTTSSSACTAPGALPAATCTTPGRGPARNSTAGPLTTSWSSMARSPAGRSRNSASSASGISRNPPLRVTPMATVR